MSTNLRKNKTEVRRKDLVYPELSYKIIGALFDVFNELGYGYRENYYQRAVGERLQELKIPFKKEVNYPLLFKNKRIGTQRIDFVIDDKVILELKRSPRILRHDLEQILSYLKAANFKLGILARFSSKGLLSRRVLNINSYLRKDS